MSDTKGEPRDPVPNPDGSAKPKPIPADTVDFDAYTRVGPGGLTRQAHVGSDPISGASIVSWAELLKQQPRPVSEDEVMLGSLPELQIDAQSDNEIIKSLQREASKSGVLNKIAGKSSQRIKGGNAAKTDQPKTDPPAPKDGSLAAKLFAGQPADSKDWYRGADHCDSSIDLMTAAADASNPLTEPKSGPASDDSSDVLAAAIQTDDGTSAVNLGQEPRASGLHSWNVTNPSPSLVPQQVRPKPPSKPQVKVSRPRPLVDWVTGAVAGVAGTALLGAGLWFGGVLPRQQNSTGSAATTTVAAAKPTAEQARRHLEAGELELALRAYAECEESPDVLTGRGQARWLSYLRKQKGQHNALAENDADVVAARKDLVRSKTPQGTLWLGLINETFGRIDAAREAYDLGRDNYPNSTRLFAAARSRLNVLTGGKKVAMRIDPQLGLALTLVMMELPPEAGGFADEAGYDFWEAVSLARKGDFTSGRAALLKARAAHEQRRDLVVRRGQNPESDPREEIFLYSCDQMLAWWDLQSKLHAAGFISHSPGEAVDALLASQKKYDDALKALVTTLRVEKVDDIAAAVDTVINQRQQAIDRWKRADEAARRAEEALKTAQRDLTKRDDEFIAARKTATTELQRALTQEAEARKSLEEVSAARRKAEDSYRAVHARLLKAKLVGEQSEPAEIVRVLDTLLSGDVSAKDAEIARLRTLLEQARRLPAVPTPAAAKADPELAEKLFSTGLQLYYAGKHAAAEEQLVAAQLNNDRDARILYFLGLSRLPQGKSNAADADFRRAADLEARNLPEPSEVAAALERIQGPDRQVINRYRR